MDFDEIKQILDMMREHELSEFELERGDMKLRLRKGGTGHWTASPMPGASHGYPPPMPAPGHVAPPAPPAAGGANVLTATDEELELVVVKSPVVGTFFSSSGPGAKPFAAVGDTVRKGDVICIIEAMKLMNEINAEIDGAVVKCYVENGQAVQYGERLFAIKPA